MSAGIAMEAAANAVGHVALQGPERLLVRTVGIYQTVHDLGGQRADAAVAAQPRDRPRQRLPAGDRRLQGHPRAAVVGHQANSPTRAADRPMPTAQTLATSAC